MFKKRYYYKATVLSIYDADTITVTIDLGFRFKADKIIRLSRINAWELRGDERNKGLLARDWLRSAIPVDSQIYIRTLEDKTGKYGRYLGEIYVVEDGNYICLNDELVLAGHARYQEY